MVPLKYKWELIPRFINYVVESDTGTMWGSESPPTLIFVPDRRPDSHSHYWQFNSHPPVNLGDKKYSNFISADMTEDWKNSLEERPKNLTLKQEIEVILSEFRYGYVEADPGEFSVVHNLAVERVLNLITS